MKEINFMTRAQCRDELQKVIKVTPKGQRKLRIRKFFGNIAYYISLLLKILEHIDNDTKR